MTGEWDFKVGVEGLIGRWAGGGFFGWGEGKAVFNMGEKREFGTISSLDHYSWDTVVSCLGILYQ